MEVLSIDDLFLQTPETKENITLKIAPQGLAMKIKSSNKVITLKKDDIREIEFFRSTQKNNMRIHTNTLININNFTDAHVEQIKTCCSQWYNLNIYFKELEIEEINKGKLMISGDFLEFKNNKLIFDLPLKEIESVHEIKNELTLSFKEKKNAVVEIKFVTENMQIANEIKERTQTTKSKEIITFETLQSVVPRGKNDYIFYNNLFKMVGSTYEHKVLYTSVKRVYYLEKDNKENYMAIQIDPPIRQGQTRYSFIVMIFNPEEEEELTLNIGKEDSEKFPNLQSTYTGNVGKTFLDILKELTKCKVTTIGNFMTLTRGKNLKCSLKAFDGHLYPLEKSLLFLPKAIHMPLNEIQNVEFSRINVSTFAAKTFDMKITTIDKSYTFNSLPKEDFGQLEQYFSEKGVKVISEVIADEVSYSSEDNDEDNDVSESNSNE